IYPLRKHIDAARCGGVDEVRDAVEHPVHVPEHGGIVHQNQTHREETEASNAEELSVASLRPGLKYPEHQSGEQDILSNLNDAVGRTTGVDPVERRVEQILEVEHRYCLLRIVLISCCAPTAPELPYFRFSPLFDRSIARTRIKSASAD